MIYISFFVSFIATIGSLYFSEIKGFIPCELCWYQRIFMYPIPLLILISIIN
ncbi:disulfide bond formation protein B, partial [Bacillus sp. AY2-1]